MTARAWWVGTLLVVLGGCSAETQIDDDGYTCADPEKSHIGPDGMPDPCHDQGAGAGGDPRCPVGEYAHWPIRWEAPTLLWFGPADQVPECPEGPTSLSYEGSTDLVAPNACEACTCQPSSGSCALSSKLTAWADVCSSQVSPIPWDAPVPWDGQCDSTTQVNAYSLTLGALSMTESGCAPGPTIPAKVLGLHWDTLARGCDIRLPAGPTERARCLTNDLAPSGFALCIFQNGENACPTDAGNLFTEQHIFYSGVQDDRQCSACSCGPPEGSICKAKISIYEEANCVAPALDQKTVSSSSTTCLDIQAPGQALKSKSAGSTTYFPGTCPAMGGDASGAAIPTEPATFCCRP